MSVTAPHVPELGTASVHMINPTKEAGSSRGLLVEMGRSLASILSSAWRVEPDVPQFCEEELSAAIPLLFASGDAGLAWWRIRNSPLANTPTGQLLHDAYRHLRLGARARE